MALLCGSLERVVLVWKKVVLACKDYCLYVFFHGRDNKKDIQWHHLPEIPMMKIMYMHKNECISCTF